LNEHIKAAQLLEIIFASVVEFFKAEKVEYEPIEQVDEKDAVALLEYIVKTIDYWFVCEMAEYCDSNDLSHEITDFEENDDLPF